MLKMLRFSEAFFLSIFIFMKVINLISGPRNLSTALMYSFAQREDCIVLDEPFYGFYLKNLPLNIVHPSQEIILNSMELEEKKIVDNIKNLATQKLVFVKGMAHHFISENPSYILEWKNIILIRHPEKLIASFSKVIHKPTINDIGIKKATQLFLFLKNNNNNPIVIDSDELMKNPENYLKKICKLLKISFSVKMLNWKKGGLPEDGIWATHWYANVHNTTKFEIQKIKSVDLPQSLQPLLKEALPYYEILKNNILKNDL